MKLLWAAQARQDLVEIRRYIARHNPKAARQWIERLRNKARAAAAAPLAGRIVPEFQQDDIREVFLRSYRIVYHVRKDSTVVLTVFEGHRLLNGLDTGDDEDS